MIQPATTAVMLLSRNIAASIDFYRALTGFSLVHSEDWCAVLAADPGSAFQLAIVDRTGAFVPRAARGVPQGTFLEIVVADVDAAVAAVRDFPIEIIEEPRGLGEYARAVLRDLDGHVLSITTPEARFQKPPRDTVE